MEPLIDHEKRLLELEKRLNALETRSRAPRWGTWTPTVTQGVSITGTFTGNYLTTGGLVVVMFSVDLTSAGTATNRVEIGGLPLNFANTDRVFGGANIQDAGTRYIHVSLYSRTSSFWMIENNTTDVVGIASGYTVANGDTIRGFGVYKAA